MSPVYLVFLSLSLLLLFFFNDTATTEIYTLSLHDALPILPPATRSRSRRGARSSRRVQGRSPRPRHRSEDRKSTRLNSSHTVISYAVFCLKKKKKRYTSIPRGYKEPEKKDIIKRTAVYRM